MALQDNYHYNVRFGFNLYTNGSIYVCVPRGIDYNAIDGAFTLDLQCPAGTWYNMTENAPSRTLWKPNPNGAPAPIRYANNDENETYTDFVEVDNEFLDNGTQEKVKNYLLYSTELTAANAEKIEKSLTGWTPANLQSIMRLGLETYDGDIGDGGEIEHLTGNTVAWRSIDEGLQQLPFYTSNFTTASTDGWLNASGALGVTSNNDGINGVDDVLKFYADSSNGLHRIIRAGFGGPIVYRLSLDYYVPAGQSNVNGITITDGVTFIPFYNTAGEWRTVTGEFTTLGASLLNIRATKGTTESFIGANDPADDLVYIKNVVVTTLDGNHGFQITVANRPDYNDVTTKSLREIDFDGVAEFLNLSAHIGDFIGDSQGEIIVVGKRRVDAEQIFISFSDAGTANQFAFGIDAAGNVFIEHNGVKSVATDFAIDDLLYHIFSVGSNDTSFTFYIDGVALTTISNNDGDWVNTVTGTLDTINIGRTVLIATTYKSINVKAMFYYNRRLTVTERGKHYQYLNNRYLTY